jgi:hypothetical protein
MKHTNGLQIPFDFQESLARPTGGLQLFSPDSRIISPAEEVDKSVNSYLIKKGIIQPASAKDELKHILFHNLLFNREAKLKISEDINWNEVKFDIATSAQDCLAAYELVYSRYQPLGFHDLTLICEPKRKSDQSHTMISGLNYDENDKRAVTVIIKGKNQLNGTLRLISGDSGLLPTEILFNQQKGLEHIRKQQQQKRKSISEISKLALNENANPILHYRTLVVSKSLIAKPLNIGNEISLVPKSEYDRRYQRIGFSAELTKCFYRELKEPDVICSWDQDTQLTRYYKNIVLKETGKKNPSPSRARETSRLKPNIAPVPAWSY